MEIEIIKYFIVFMLSNTLMLLLLIRNDIKPDLINFLLYSWIIFWFMLSGFIYRTFLLFNI